MTERPEVLNGTTAEFITGCGKIHVTLNETEAGKLVECFVTLGKSGGCAAAQCQSIGRLVAIALHYNAPVEKLIKQLRGTSCHQPVGFGGKKIMSCPDAVGRALGDWLKRRKKEEKEERAHPKESKSEPKPEPEKEKAPVIASGACPDCGGMIEHSEGCEKCSSCGYTKC